MVDESSGDLTVVLVVGALFLIGMALLAVASQLRFRRRVEVPGA